jgi:hypothetical protein
MIYAIFRQNKPELIYIESNQIVHHWMDLVWMSRCGINVELFQIRLGEVWLEKLYITYDQTAQYFQHLILKPIMFSFIRLLKRGLRFHGMRKLWACAPSGSKN